MTGHDATRVLAYYLPQFHPIPENDAAWGPGFSEWTNVARARPLFRGHEQPVLPGELGFYDLRLAETRVAQAELARAHGVAGFVYWHYWFEGRRLLERPFEEVLASGEPDFPFCLGWANTSWTGIWYGAPNSVIVEQTYGGEQDYRRHFEHVLPALRDRRYVRVEGRPLFLVFQPSELPDAREFCRLWQRWAADSGLGGLHLVGFSRPGIDPTRTGFDAAVPHSPRPSTVKDRGLRRAWRKLRRRPHHVDYADYVARPYDDRIEGTTYPVALSNWDNTPRSRERGFVLTDSDPDRFRVHLERCLASVAHHPPERRLVFLKSWNEWAEGNYVEPDARYGRGWLEAIRAALDPTAAGRPSGDRR
jgi:lipopolysaccharide biosynthesis protein